MRWECVCNFCACIETGLFGNRGGRLSFSCVRLLCARVVCVPVSFQGLPRVGCFLRPRFRRACFIRARSLVLRNRVVLLRREPHFPAPAFSFSGGPAATFASRGVLRHARSFRRRIRRYCEVVRVNRRAFLMIADAVFFALLSALLVSSLSVSKSPRPVEFAVLSTCAEDFASAAAQSPELVSLSCKTGYASPALSAYLSPALRAFPLARFEIRCGDGRTIVLQDAPVGRFTVSTDRVIVNADGESELVGFVASR